MTSEAQPFLYLRDRRRRRGLSQTALAARAKVSVSHLNMVESGQRGASPALYARLATALDDSIDNLIDNAPEVPSQPRPRVVAS